jgi:hypothetical protein
MELNDPNSDLMTVAETASGLHVPRQLSPRAVKRTSRNGADVETRLLYDRKEAARQLSVSVRSLDYIIAAKGLDTRRIGRKVLVTRASLMRYASGNHFDAVKESTAALSEVSSKCA